MRGKRVRERLLAGACALLLGGVPVQALDFNLIPNGDFDDGGDPVAGWVRLSPQFSFLGPITEDADDCVGSGAASGDNFSDDTEAASAGFTACATAIVVGESYRLSGRIRFPFGTSPSRMTVLFRFSPETTCTGNLEGGAALPSYIENENADDLEYVPINLGPAVAPAGAKSARIDVVLQKENAADKVAYLYFDKFYLTQADFVFAEDFEFDSLACRWTQEIGFE